MTRRGRVQWKPDAVREPALRPHPYYAAAALSAEEHDRLQPHLVPGAMWTTAVDMTVERVPVGTASHEVPYLLLADWDPIHGRQTVHAPRGSMAVYIGTIRVDEATRHGETVRVARHAFLVGGSRYIVADLQSMTPVTS